MRVLILGGDGMMGHRLFKLLRQTHDARVTLHRDLVAYAGYGLFDIHTAYAGIDVRTDDRIGHVVAEFRPQVIVNAVGIIKQRVEAKDAIPSIEINALLPHRLAALGKSIGARVVHLSTDCVFSGRRGGYAEASLPDAEDLYGRSKLLGELTGPGSITLRTSMIGPELARKSGLVEWFLAQRGEIRGFKQAIFSGFTTVELSRIIEMVLTRFPDASGVYHVSSAPVSKYDLLTMIRDRLKRPVEILTDETFHCDRSLDSSRFRREFGYSPPAWPAMIEELADELKERA